MASLQEHKDTVAKYVKNLNKAALDKMGKNYALVLSNKDSQFVSCGDEGERNTVRENFMKKKLGLKDSDDVLNTSIDAVCATMKEDRFKSRLAFYYMLADKHNKLGLFA